MTPKTSHAPYPTPSPESGERERISRIQRVPKYGVDLAHAHPSLAESFSSGSATDDDGYATSEIFETPTEVLDRHLFPNGTDAFWEDREHDGDDDEAVGETEARRRVLGLSHLTYPAAVEASHEEI